MAEDMAMKASIIDELEVGMELPPLTKQPISRTTLALFAGASGDHNPIHIDIDFAKQSGAPDVFAHGMLPMAYLGQLLTNWVPQAAIRNFSVRFVSVSNLSDQITCRGKIIDIQGEAVGNENRAQIELVATNQDGDVKLRGTAEISLS